MRDSLIVGVIAVPVLVIAYLVSPGATPMTDSTQVAENAKQTLEEYLVQVDEAARSIRALDSADTDTLGALTRGVSSISSLAEIDERASEHELSDDQLELVADYKTALKAAQKRLLPKLRDAYGPVMR